MTDEDNNRVVMIVKIRFIAISICLCKDRAFLIGIQFFGQRT